jgi:hypothetical protein
MFVGALTRRARDHFSDLRLLLVGAQRRPRAASRQVVRIGGCQSTTTSRSVYCYKSAALIVSQLPVFRGG